MTTISAFEKPTATTARRTGLARSTVTYLVPGFIATGVLFSGIGTASAMAEDLEQGFIDRLRSLPIPRSSVLAARVTADTAILAWSTAFTTVHRDGPVRGQRPGRPRHGNDRVPVGVRLERIRAGQLNAELPTVFAKHQPLTYMVGAARSLTLGPHAQALLGHSGSYFATRAHAGRGTSCRHARREHPLKSRLRCRGAAVAERR
jgi:ABC-2 type transport system permease protein